MKIRQIAVSLVGAALIATGSAGVAVAATKGVATAHAFKASIASNESCLSRGATTVYNGCSSNVILIGIMPRIETSEQTYDTLFGLTANSSSEARFTGYRADGGWMWTGGWRKSNEVYNRNLTYQTTAGWDTYVPFTGSVYMEVRLQSQGTLHYTEVSN